MSENSSTFEEIKNDQIKYNLAMDKVIRDDGSELPNLYEQMKDRPPTYKNLTKEMLVEAIKDFQQGKNINNQKENKMSITNKKMYPSQEEMVMSRKSSHPEKESYKGIKESDPYEHTFNGLVGEESVSYAGTVGATQNPTVTEEPILDSPSITGWNTMATEIILDSYIYNEKERAIKKAKPVEESILGTISDDNTQINVYSFGDEMLLRYFVDNTYQDEIRLSREMQKGLMNFLTSNLIK